MTEARTRSYFWRLARPLSAVGALLAVSALTGCSDDEAVTPETSTTGGSGGTTTGAGGSSTGGKGGASGKGGAAGNGGKAGGGGTTGTGGKAGAGGTGAGGGTGGKGGGAGGSTGGNGHGGTAGTGGATGGTGGTNTGGTGTGGATGGTGGTNTGGMGTGGATGGTGGTNTGGTGTGGATGGTGGTNTGGTGTGGTTGGSGGGGAGGSGGSPTVCGPATGDGSITKAVKVAEDATKFFSPFDATPSPDGCTVYFTAISSVDGTGAVFSVKSDGTGLALLSNGLIAPTGIAVSTDGSTLYVADPGGAEDVNTLGKDGGLLVSLPAGGGNPTTIVKGGVPVSVTVAKEGTGDTLYYGGFDTGTASWAVFKSTGASGSGTVALSGLKGAGGIAVLEPAGTIYAVDSGLGWLVTGAGASPTAIAKGLHVGVSAGLAISADGASLVASAIANNNGAFSSIEKFALAGGAPTEQQPTSIQGLIEAAGLHRAAKVEVYAWVDGLGAGKGGAVYVLSK